ncbi:alpha/beta hydrolase [Micromonospora sp. NPDC050397]|uniref:alpha/beta hydrolase n=1 Tax=Micromonospora sp. NPDC050397 TaxID=3364279 RepID=UPI00385071CC
MTTSYATQQVEFPSSGETLIGDLYVPTTEPGRRCPAVIVVGAWGTVKEQMPGGYAREMASRGYLALTFDFRGWGGSTGRPRSMEDPFAKAADIVAAAEFLGSRPDVARDAIGGIGICAGSAYMATAATRTEFIRSVALVAPALPSRATVEEQLGGQPGVTAVLSMAREARDEYDSTGNERLVPAVPPMPEDSVDEPDYYHDRTRGAVPQWNNTFNPASWLSWLEYDAHAAAAALTDPLLIVHSEAAVKPDSVREFIALVPGEVRQIWLDDVTQFDFYDRPGPMQLAGEAMADHFASLSRAKI